MEVKIGVQYAPRELVLESAQTASDVVNAVTEALSSESGVLDLVDEKGKRIIVPDRQARLRGDRRIRGPQGRLHRRLNTRPIRSTGHGRLTRSAGHGRLIAPVGCPWSRSRSKRLAEQLGAPSRSGASRAHHGGTRRSAVCRATPNIAISAGRPYHRTCCRGGDGQPDLRRGERVGPRRHLPFASRVARARKMSAPVASPGRSRLTRDTPLTKKHIEESTQLDTTSPDLELADPSVDLAEVPALAARAPVRPDSPTFAELGARPETVAALLAVGIERSFAIQEYALPDRAARHRPDRPGAHRYGQDARLRRPAAGPAARPERGCRRPAPGAGRGTHPGARPAGRARPGHGRKDPRRTRAAGLRRRRLRAADRGAQARCRDHRRYARPAAGPVQAGEGQASSPTCGWTRSTRSCSTRPTGCSTSASSTTSRRSWRCCRGASDDALLGHDAGPDRDAGPAVPAPPGHDPRRATTPRPPRRR